METHELSRWMGRMESKQDAILQNIAAQTKRLDNHSERISKLERGRAWLIGAGAGVGLMLSQLKHVKEMLP
jgi:hypothetical protein